MVWSSGAFVVENIADHSRALYDVLWTNFQLVNHFYFNVLRFSE